MEKTETLRYGYPAAEGLDETGFKRQLFFSNIRMVLETIGGIMAAFLTAHIFLAYMSFESRRFQGHWGFAPLRSPESGGFILFISFAIFVAFTVC